MKEFWVLVLTRSPLCNIQNRSWSYLAWAANLPCGLLGAHIVVKLNGCKVIRSLNTHTTSPVCIPFYLCRFSSVAIPNSSENKSFRNGVWFVWQNDFWWCVSFHFIGNPILVRLFVMRCFIRYLSLKRYVATKLSITNALPGQVDLKFVLEMKELWSIKLYLMQQNEWILLNKQKLNEFIHNAYLRANWWCFYWWFLVVGAIQSLWHQIVYSISLVETWPKFVCWRREQFPIGRKSPRITNETEDRACHLFACLLRFAPFRFFQLSILFFSIHYFVASMIDLQWYYWTISRIIWKRRLLHSQWAFRVLWF